MSAQRACFLDVRGGLTCILARGKNIDPVKQLSEHCCEQEREGALRSGRVRVHCWEMSHSSTRDGSAVAMLSMSGLAVVSPSRMSSQTPVT